MMSDEIENPDHEDSDDLNPKKRGLGRGLNALFEDEEGVYPQADAEGQTPAGARRINLGVEQLEPSIYQPRRKFDEAALKELAESIARHGVLQPLLVRPKAGFDDQYEIIAGERRWRAAQMAKLHEVPVVLRPLSDDETLQIALIENLQREDLNAIEEAQAFNQLVEEFSHTQEQLAEFLGKSRSHIANTMRLLKLPRKVQQMVEADAISAGHARALIGAGDPESLAEQVVREGLSVREIEALVGQDPAKAANKKAAKPSGAQKDVDTLALEKEISDVLGMKVSINVKPGGKGTLVVSYESLDQLDEVLHRLSHNPGRMAISGE